MPNPIDFALTNFNGEIQKEFLSPEHMALMKMHFSNLTDLNLSLGLSESQTQNNILQQIAAGTNGHGVSRKINGSRDFFVPHFNNY